MSADRKMQNLTAAGGAEKKDRGLSRRLSPFFSRFPACSALEFSFLRHDIVVSRLSATSRDHLTSSPRLRGEWFFNLDFLALLAFLAILRASVVGFVFFEFQFGTEFTNLRHARKKYSGSLLV